MSRRKKIGWVIAKNTPDGVKPVSTVLGTQEDAEKSASKMPSWYVMGNVTVHDWRDNE